MKKLLARFLAEDDGAAMVEYSILIGIITAAVIAIIVSVGGWVGTQWSDLWTELQAASAP